VPDNDAPGESHAQHVAGSVAPYAKEVKIARLPGLPKSGDVSDYLQQHSPADLANELKQAALWKPRL